MGPFPKYLTYKNVVITGILIFVIAAILKATWWVFLFVFLVGATISYFGTTQISSNFHMPSFCKAYHHNKKEIALTFDDGVTNPEQSNKVLDVLKQYQATATFFCIGKNLESDAQVDVLKRMDAEGHIIGNHSYSHAPLFDFYNAARVLKEVEETDKIIHQHIGKRTDYFRPPYGITTPNIAKAIKTSKHKTIGWSLRSLDTVLKDEKMLMQRVTKKLKQGDILLFHDHLECMPAFLSLFLEYVLKEGYTIVGVDQLLNLEPYRS